MHCSSDFCLAAWHATSSMTLYGSAPWVHCVALFFWPLFNLLIVMVRACPASCSKESLAGMRIDRPQGEVLVFREIKLERPTIRVIRAVHASDSAAACCHCCCPDLQLAIATLQAQVVDVDLNCCVTFAVTHYAFG